MTTGRELQHANESLGRVLTEAQKLLAKRFPGVTARVPLEHRRFYLEFCRNELRLTNGEIGSRCTLFRIDKAAPHQRIMMADYLRPLYAELEGTSQAIVDAVREATSKVAAFNREHK